MLLKPFSMMRAASGGAPTYPIGFKPYATWNVSSHPGFGGTDILTLSGATEVYAGFKISGIDDSPLTPGATYRLSWEVLDPDAGGIAGSYRFNVGNAQYVNSSGGTAAASFAVGSFSPTFVAAGAYTYTEINVGTSANSRMQNFAIEYVSGP